MIGDEGTPHVVADTMSINSYLVLQCLEPTAEFPSRRHKFIK
jgi:hypothetical protein